MNSRVLLAAAILVLLFTGNVEAFQGFDKYESPTASLNLPPIPPWKFPWPDDPPTPPCDQGICDPPIGPLPFPGEADDEPPMCMILGGSVYCGFPGPGPLPGPPGIDPGDLCEGIGVCPGQVPPPLPGAGTPGPDPGELCEGLDCPGSENPPGEGWEPCATPPDGLCWGLDCPEGPPPWPSIPGSPGVPINTGNPVNFAYGDKRMSVVDVLVPLVGKDFSIGRLYTSDPAFGGPGLVGENWTMNIFYFLEGAGTAGDPDVLSLSSPAIGTMSFEKEGTTWKPAGPSHQTIAKAELLLGGETYGVWRLSEPGVGEIDFYRHPEQGHFSIDNRLRGLLLQHRDVYGNPRTYEYDTTDGARLMKVYLNGEDASDAEALVVLTWYTEEGPLVGRLERLEVQRHDGNGWVTRQQVEYTYMDEDATSTFDPAVGTDGDLVQVARYIWVDHDPAGAPTGENDWHITVEQYRYHDNTEETSDTDGDGFVEVGGFHQLKAVILPQQIEYAAQIVNASESEPQSVLAFANSLLADADETTVYTGRTVIELASKVIEQYDDEDRVEVQYLQTACGCGGGGGLGLKLEYAYTEYTTSGDRTLKVTHSVDDSGWSGCLPRSNVRTESA